MEKKMLLIGGGGTLGVYTAMELLDKGCRVDILCMNEPQISHRNLQILRDRVDLEVLKAQVSQCRYDGIVNFLHYSTVEEYRPVHMLLSANTEHLIFLSSYRVYGPSEKPITEETPQLLDMSRDEQFLADRTYYALAKAVLERYIREESGTDNWTNVRPVISFGHMRLDLVTRSGRKVLEAARKGEVFELPLAAKELTAGLDWAGNSGKLIANLLLREETKGQTYTVSSAQNLTWGQVADIYTELLGVQIRWIDTPTYMEKYCSEPYMLLYDRLYDRRIDNRKILEATGLTKADFLPIRDGIKIELRKHGWGEEK